MTDHSERRFSPKEIVIERSGFHASRENHFAQDDTKRFEVNHG